MSQFYLTEQDIQTIRTMRQWQATFNGPGVVNSGSSASIAAQSTVQANGQTMPLVVACKITSAVSGRVGWYNAKSARKPAKTTPTGALAETDITDGWADSEDCLVQYMPDIGASAASITAFTDLKKVIVTGLFRGFDHTLGKRIVVVNGAGSADPLTYYRVHATYTAGTSSNPASVDYCDAAGNLTGATGSETIPTLDAGTVITTSDVIVKGETPTKLMSDIQWSSPYLQKRFKYRFQKFATAESAWVNAVTFTTYP